MAIVPYTSVDELEFEIANERLRSPKRKYPSLLPQWVLQDASMIGSVLGPWPVLNRAALVEWRNSLKGIGMYHHQVLIFECAAAPPIKVITAILYTMFRVVVAKSLEATTVNKRSKKKMTFVFAKYFINAGTTPEWLDAMAEELPGSRFAIVE